MTMDHRSLEQIIKELPPESQAKVRDFVEALRNPTIRGHRLKQGWAGALREYREKYTSVELQKKSLGWRGD